MKKTLLLLTITLFAITTFAQRFEWLSSSRQYNSNQNIPVATDSAGNVYTLIDAYTPGIVIQGDTIYENIPNTSGTVVAKFGPAGNIIWGKMISPDGGSLTGGMIAVDNAGSVYASLILPNIGNINLNDTAIAVIGGVGVIVKLNSNGSSLRATSFASFSSAPIFSCLGTDLYVAYNHELVKTDSAFNTIWSINDPTNSLDFEHNVNSKADIYVQSNGQLVVSAWEFGNTIGDIPFGNDTVHFHLGGLDEGAIMKLDTSGHVLWTRAFACNDYNPAIRAVCLDKQGNVFLACQGYTYNSPTIFGNDTLLNTLGTGDYCAIFEWDDSGNPVRAKALYPFASPPVLCDLGVNPAGDFLVSGTIGTSRMFIDANDSIDGYNNFFLIKYDSSGIYKWFKTEAHNTSTFIDGIAVRYGNEYILGGSTGSGSNYQFDCIEDPTTGPTNFVTVISEYSVVNPLASFTFTSVGLDYTFSDQSQNATAWHWDFGDGDTSNIQSPAHTYAIGGNYTVILTASIGGCSSSDTVLIIGLGIDNVNDAASFLLFPNPASGNFRISSTNNAHITSVEINDIVGSNVFDEQFNSVSRAEINMNNVSEGVYFVKIHENGKVITKKLIVGPH